MFNLDHILWLIISVAMIGLLTFFSVKKKWSFKTCIIIMSCIALASEIFKICTHMFTVSERWYVNNPEASIVKDYPNAMYLLPKSLPFHLCSILIFFIFIMALTKNENLVEKMKTFCVPIFLIAGTLAIILNTSFDKDIKMFSSFIGDGTLDSFSAYQYFIYHAGIVWLGLYLMITKQVKFGLKEWIRNSVILFALLVFAIWINSFFIDYETNFMFVVYPPAKGLPFLNLNHGWYVYMVHYILTGAILTFLFQLKWIIPDIKNLRKAK